jgi:serine/threonine protein kinase
VEKHDDGFLGSGNFAEVYKGRWGAGVTPEHIALLPPIAIKVLRHSCHSKKEMEKFSKVSCYPLGNASTHGRWQAVRREVTIWNRLRHKHIVSFVGVCTNFGPASLLSEWMEHGTVYTPLV